LIPKQFILTETGGFNLPNRYPPNNNIIILQVIIIHFGFWLIRTKLEQEINLEQEKTL
jgi:hypothetical protein